jgi:pyruvate dehydrogenase E2 component (dihydrolipoamide acetyltransferase)
VAAGPTPSRPHLRPDLTRTCMRCSVCCRTPKETNLTTATGLSPGVPEPDDTYSERLPRLRRVIARRLMQSLQTSAQLTTVVEVDVTGVASLRSKIGKVFADEVGVKLSYLPFFAVAAIEALKRYPILNASVDVDATRIEYHRSQHLGVAVDTEHGLLVPVIRHADRFDIAGLARSIDDVALRTRNKTIASDELSGGTFTITNTGSRGALFDTPILNPPEAAILGVGAVVRRPALVTGESGEETIGVRSLAFLALTYDHRIIDGADAARFLTAVRGRIEGAEFAAVLPSWAQ